MHNCYQYILQNVSKFSPISLNAKCCWIYLWPLMLFCKLVNVESVAFYVIVSFSWDFQSWPDTTQCVTLLISIFCFQRFYWLVFLFGCAASSLLSGLFPLAAGSGGCSLAVVCGLPMGVASLPVQRGLQSARVVAVHRLSSCGSWALEPSPSQ